MLEARGNLWEMVGPNDALVITTNGFVTKAGTAVMGRGIALQATERDPTVASRLGRLLGEFGNRVYVIHDEPLWLSFPVKEHWKDRADLNLIKQSAEDLVQAVEVERLTKPIYNIYLPRPGCGNGRRSWAEVKPIIEPYLNDDYIVVTYENVA